MKAQTGVEQLFCVRPGPVVVWVSHVPSENDQPNTPQTGPQSGVGCLTPLSWKPGRSRLPANQTRFFFQWGASVRHNYHTVRQKTLNILNSVQQRNI